MILVTGGSGYVGSVLVRQLLDKGYKIRVLDVGIFGHGALNEVRNKIELVEDDIRTCSVDVFDGISDIIHLAGFSNDPTAEYRPKENFTVNVDGTRHLAKLAKKVKARKFIFGSSCSVYYTTNPDDKEKTEEDFITPTVPYSISKHLAEDIVLKAGVFTPVILRKGTVYGLSPRMRYDLVVNTMVKDAYQNRRISLHQGGRMWRPLVDIEDAARAYIFALENKSLSGIYNLVGMNILVSRVADEIQKTLKNEFGVDVEIERQDVGVARSYRVSLERFRKAGFTEFRPLSRAVKDLWEDIEKNKRDFSDNKYYNIRVFEEKFTKENV